MTLQTPLLALGAVIVAWCLGGGCAPSSQGQNQKQNAGFAEEELLLLPAATRVRRGSEYRGSVAYELDSPYPATESLREIERRLVAAGWGPQSDDLSNPGGKSPLRQWDIVESSAETYFTWKAYWEDPQHNVLMASLEYGSSKKDNELIPTGTCRVLFIRFARDTAEALRKGIKR